ncbi:hypothetical protein Dsin_012703 [Dipteronia sinensis]|uniref:Reverse transcriptase domain-containing protein n=1 Tax=Dipteronia sinensis TaxID=43782 RepID=A0AAE0AJ12_9ROSI|nr:hypothetical protein Dsin_012703 [Dipteronia sinensis]
MAIKLDMSKAYDRIERMMRKLGFSDRWISLVMRCISFVSYSFVLNGTVCGLVHPSKGLRQGDLLLPYLFLICAEGFSSLISQAVSMREIQGFQCSRNGLTISHLFFADDSLLFAQATDYNCKSIRRILDTYARASGQVINFAKLAMCVSPSVSSHECTRLAAFIGIGVVDCHESYLGLPCLAGMRKKEIFSGIISKIWDKIRGWRDKFLSTGGKEVLIKAVIQAIPTYTMNLFQLPKSLLKEIYRLCTRFWWGSNGTSRKIHRCTWAKLCEAKGIGGLGFRDLEIFNQALLANQCWRILSNGNSLAGRVLKACYFPDGDFMNAESKSTASFIWKS